MAATFEESLMANMTARREELRAALHQGVKMSGVCPHNRIEGDNYGETCMDCGEQLAGWGFWAEGGRECLHQWMSDGAEGEVCSYCEEWRPVEKGQEVVK